MTQKRLDNKEKNGDLDRMKNFLEHWNHKYFVPGVPLWSYWNKGSLYCDTCKIYFINTFFYLIKLVIYEIKNLDSSFFRLIIFLNLLKYNDKEYKYRWFFERGDKK
jgi:hypothetical protein